MSKIQRVSSNPASVPTSDIQSGSDGLLEADGPQTAVTSHTRPFNDGLVIDLAEPATPPHSEQPSSLARSMAAEGKMQANVRSAELQAQLNGSSSAQKEPTSVEFPNLTLSPPQTGRDENSVYQHNQTDLEFAAGKNEVSIESLKAKSPGEPK